MVNEKKNATLENLMTELLRDGKAVRLPLKDIVEKQVEAVMHEAAMHEAAKTETSQEGSAQDTLREAATVTINIDKLHIHMDERMKTHNYFGSDNEPAEIEDCEDSDEAMVEFDPSDLVAFIKEKTCLCENVIMEVLNAQFQYFDFAWGIDENPDDAKCSNAAKYSNEEVKA